MGVERLARQAALRRPGIQIPWVSYPREITSLSGIIATIDAMALDDIRDEAERKFWQTLRDNIIGTARHYNRLEAAQVT